MLREGFEPSTPGLEPGVVAVRLPELGTIDLPYIVPAFLHSEYQL